MIARTAVACLALLAMAGIAATQEEETQEREAPRRHIQVLHHPYEIASFYRSHQGEEIFGYPAEALDPSSPYSLAGFYRQRQVINGYGYGPFWSGGYASRNRAGFVIGYRRSIGENGDLFLFAPTFLAPIGPLTGIFFFGGR